MEASNMRCSICQVCSITYCVCNKMKKELSPVAKDTPKLPKDPNKPCSICEQCSMTYCVCDGTKEKPSSKDEKPSKHDPSVKPSEEDIKICSVCNLCSGLCDCKQPATSQTQPEQDDKTRTPESAVKPADEDTKTCSVCNVCTGLCDCKQQPKDAIVKEEPKPVGDTVSLQRARSTGGRPCKQKCWGGCKCKSQPPESVIQPVLKKQPSSSEPAEEICKTVCWDNCTCGSHLPSKTAGAKSPIKEKMSGDDIWPRFIDAVCSIELEEDLLASPMTYGFETTIGIMTTTSKESILRRISLTDTPAAEPESIIRRKSLTDSQPVQDITKEDTTMAQGETSGGCKFICCSRCKCTPNQAPLGSGENIQVPAKDNDGSCKYMCCSRCKCGPYRPPLISVSAPETNTKGEEEIKVSEETGKPCTMCTVCDQFCMCNTVQPQQIKEEEEIKVSEETDRPCTMCNVCDQFCMCNTVQSRQIKESILARAPPCNKCSICWEDCTCEKINQMPVSMPAKVSAERMSETETTLPDKSKQPKIPSPETTGTMPETTAETVAESIEAPEETPEIVGEFPEATEIAEAGKATGEVTDTAADLPVAEEIAPVDKQIADKKSVEVPHSAAEGDKQGTERPATEIMGKDIIPLNVIISLTIPPCNCGSKEKKPPGEAAPIIEETVTKQADKPFESSPGPVSCRVMKEDLPPGTIKEAVEAPTEIMVGKPIESSAKAKPEETEEAASDPVIKVEEIFIAEILPTVEMAPPCVGSEVTQEMTIEAQEPVMENQSAKAIGWSPTSAVPNVSVMTPISTAAGIKKDSIIPCNVCTVCPPGLCECLNKLLPTSVLERSREASTDRTAPLSVLQPKDVIKSGIETPRATSPTITELAKRSSRAKCLSCQVCTGTCDCADDDVIDATQWLLAITPSKKSITPEELGIKSEPLEPDAAPIPIEGASTEAAPPAQQESPSTSAPLEVSAPEPIYESAPPPETLEEMTKALATVGPSVTPITASPPDIMPSEDVVEAPIDTIAETASVCSGGVRCWFGCTCKPQEQADAEPSEKADDTARSPEVTSPSEEEKVEIVKTPELDEDLKQSPMTYGYSPEQVQTPVSPLPEKTSEKQMKAIEAPPEEEEDIWPKFIDAVCSIELDEDLERSPMTYGYREHGMLADLMNLTPEQIGIPLQPLPEKQIEGKVVEAEPEETEDIWPKFIDAVCTIELDEDLEQSPMTYGYRLHGDVTNITPEQVGIPVPPPMDKEPSPEEDIWSKFIKDEAEKPLVESETDRCQRMQTAESPTEDTFDDMWPKFIDNICGQELEEDLAISPMTCGIQPPFFIDVPSASKLENEVHEGAVTTEEEKVVKTPVTAADRDIPCTLCTLCSINTCVCDHPKISAPIPAAEGEIPCTLCTMCSINTCICDRQKISAPVPTADRDKGLPCTLCTVCSTSTCVCDHPKISDTGAPETKEALPTTAVYDDASQAELESAFIVMEQKCRTKDQIITALANELRLRSQSGRFEELLNKLSKEESMIPEPRDFDRDQLCQYLRKPDGYPAAPPTPHPEPLSARGMEQGPTCGSPVCPSAQEDVCSTIIPSPLGLQVLKRIGPDGLLLGWNIPKGACFTGYEIFVNGTLKHRVRSNSRNKALLLNLDLNQKNVITMYALTPNGRSAEPACVVYPDPNQDIEISLRITTSCHC